MEELKAMFRVCVHVKKDGVRCNSPAMKGMNFCYQHIGGNIRELTRARSTYAGPKLDFVYPGCRQAIQHNFFVIAQAMNDGHIDLQTANTYNRIYSACERNLRRFETLYQKDADAELAPLPDETPGAETDDNLGGPLKPAVGLSGEQTETTDSPQQCHPETESVAQATNAGEGSAVPQSPENPGASSFRGLCERVGDDESQSSDNVGAPRLEKTWVQESNQQDDVPLKPSSTLNEEQQTETTDSPQPCHPETESVAQATNADEGSAVPQSPENPGAPRLEEAWEQAEGRSSVSGHGFSHAETSPENTGALAPERTLDPSPTVIQEQPITFDTRKIDFKKYDPRFKELERLYSDHSDYIDRLCAAIRQIHKEEEQAWRDAGCPDR